MTLEKDLRKRLDEKWKDALESQRRDERDYNNKIVALKSEMSLGMLDKNMIDFIKKIKKEWNKVLSRSSKCEELMKEL